MGACTTARRQARFDYLRKSERVGKGRLARRGGGRRHLDVNDGFGAVDGRERAGFTGRYGARRDKGGGARDLQTWRNRRSASLDFGNSRGDTAGRGDGEGVRSRSREERRAPRLHSDA